MKTLYESILDDIDRTLAEGDEYKEVSHTFNWIAGRCTIIEVRAIKGGVRKNLEELIGKKHKDRTFYIGPISDRIYNGLDKKLKPENASFRSRMFNWLAAIILETKFDEPIETLNQFVISKGVEKHLNETLNELCIDDDKKFLSQVYYNSFQGRFEVHICIQSKSNPRHPAPTLTILTFEAAEAWLKNRIK